MSRAAPAIPTAQPTQRQIAMLERLAEIGMEIAEAAGRQAVSGEARTVDPGLTYARAARAVRLTIALQQRLADDAAKARTAEAGRRRDRIHSRVERIIETDREHADEAERLSTAAWERLTETEDEELLDLPFDEAVALICRDLGLSPVRASRRARLRDAQPRAPQLDEGGCSPPTPVILRRPKAVSKDAPPYCNPAPSSA